MPSLNPTTGENLLVTLLIGAAGVGIGYVIGQSVKAAGAASPPATGGGTPTTAPGLEPPPAGTPSVTVTPGAQTVHVTPQGVALQLPTGAVWGSSMGPNLAGGDHVIYLAHGTTTSGDAALSWTDASGAPQKTTLTVVVA